jgi:hypothetical protein
MYSMKADGSDVVGLVFTKRGPYQGVRYVPIRRECAYFDPWPLSEEFFLMPWGIISDRTERRLQEKDNETNMRLARPTKDVEQLRRQEFGGDFIWPDEIDRDNPTGVEYHRPIP